MEHHLCGAGFLPECRRVETEADFVAHLSPAIDVILSDYTLPGWNALRALELVRASHLEVPFIVVSGTISEEVAVECMRRGAADYLLKDRLGRLGPAVARAIEDIAERRLAESLASRLMKTQEDERRRISRELHDQVGQAMTALLLELNHLEAALPKASAARARLRACLQLAEQNAAAVRDMALLLRPSMLDDLGLVSALSWQAREVTRRHGMKVTVDADEACNCLPDELRTCIYRVVQEALHNAARHAHAEHAYVAVRQEQEHIRVRIEDDGHGFDARHQKGMGLLGMEERVRSLGGMLQIESEPGCGACISILLPQQQVDSPVDSPTPEKYLVAAR
jgi:signal transduction histidine kinase